MRNDLEKAINHFYEHGIPLGRQSSTKFIDLRQSPTSLDTLHSSNPRQTSVISSCDGGTTMAWLIGRRIAFGYTLNPGIAVRSHSLSFKFEGQLLEKSKKQFFSSKLKQKQKFSAANLLFECGPASAVFLTLHFLNKFYK